ncbi:hypothetical protein PIB30_056623 [Stylosanthes scabra]|uniref:Uncharacterized protein n=1 Tax=Stylosanthes scabra TaxID=79078 RepID=A0ABU6ZI68_9FABA|nr:hypothetical protein [Stylosanthes scabra]
MGKKKSCQNVKVLRPLNAVEQGLYGWVEETIFTQPSVLEDSLPKLRRHMSLTEDAAAEGDFVLEAAGPSDRLPFQASEERSDYAVPGGGEPAPFKWLGSPADLRTGLPPFRMKKTKLDRMMADPSRMAPRAILPTGATSATADAAAAAASSTAAATFSANPATPAAQVPPPPPTSSKDKKSSSKRERPEVVNVEGEEGVKEDTAADLRQKRRRKEKGKEEDLVDRVLGEDSAWEHAINPLELAF